jgi:hypothetical protein
VDEELKRLNLATAEARRLATDALEALRAPQTELRDAAVAYVASVAARRVAASRHASVDIMAQLSDEDLAELRMWTDEQSASAQQAVAERIEACDFWIPETSGLSPSDVTDFSGALLPRPKDTRTGIPQALVQLIDECLTPLRRGLGAIGMALIPTDAEPRIEVALARAWQAYRDAAVECVSRWADVDEHYFASAERFQEMRWENAAEAAEELRKAREAAGDEEPAEDSLAAQAEAAATAPVEAVVQGDTETLVPVTS